MTEQSPYITQKRLDGIVERVVATLRLHGAHVIATDVHPSSLGGYKFVLRVLVGPSDVPLEDLQVEARATANTAASDDWGPFIVHVQRVVDRPHHPLLQASQRYSDEDVEALEQVLEETRELLAREVSRWAKVVEAVGGCSPSEAPRQVLGLVEQAAKWARLAHTADLVPAASFEAVLSQLTQSQAHVQVHTQQAATPPWGAPAAPPAAMATQKELADLFAVLAQQLSSVSDRVTKIENRVRPFFGAP